jgi:hypothetical protein
MRAKGISQYFIAITASWVGLVSGIASVVLLGAGLTFKLSDITQLRYWLIAAFICYAIASYSAWFRQHKEIAELRKWRVKFEVDTKIFRSTVCLGANDDETAYCLIARLGIRFRNYDGVPLLVDNLSLSIVTPLGEEPLSSDFIETSLKNPDSEGSTYFNGISVPGGSVTGCYLFDYNLNVPRSCAESVDENSFLRATMQAGAQDQYSTDLDVDWRAARKGNTEVTLRPKERK